MFIRNMENNLLRYECTIELAEKWIVENGYRIKYISGNAIYVVNANYWFI